MYLEDINANIIQVGTLKTIYGLSGDDLPFLKTDSIDVSQLRTNNE